MHVTTMCAYTYVQIHTGLIVCLCQVNPLLALMTLAEYRVDVGRH